MIYHNRTDSEFYPLGDAGADFDSRRDQELAPLQLETGLYYRQRLFSSLHENVLDCLDGKIPFSKLSLDADQVNNELAWKEPQATLAAALRFSQKAREEYQEVDIALEEFWDGGGSEHFLEELGDFKWCVTAIASNAGVVANDSIKTRLYEYASGTKQLIEGRSPKPKWYDAAAALAIKWDPITFGDIDELIVGGFVPRYSPAMNLYDEEVISPTSFMFDFSSYAVFLRGLSEQLYDKNHSIYHQGPSQEGAAHTIGKLLAETYFRTAAMAHYAGSTIAEVIEINTLKIADRVATNSIDKSDDNRQN